MKRLENSKPKAITIIITVDFRRPFRHTIKELETSSTSHPAKREAAKRKKINWSRNLQLHKPPESSLSLSLSLPTAWTVGCCRCRRCNRCWQPTFLGRGILTLFLLRLLFLSHQQLLFLSTPPPPSCNYHTSNRRHFLSPLPGMSTRSFQDLGANYYCNSLSFSLAHWLMLVFLWVCPFYFILKVQEKLEPFCCFTP